MSAHAQTSDVGHVSSPGTVEPCGPGSLSPRAGGWATWLSTGLVPASLASGLLTFVVSDWVQGPAVSVGNARGTALVVLVVAVPLLVAGLVLRSRGSLRGVLLWVGSVGYLLYNAQMVLFATRLSRMFLCYVAMLSLSVWSAVAILAHTDVPQLHTHVTGWLPARSIAVSAWVVVALDALVWRKGIMPAATSDEPGHQLQGSGATTNPVYVQDPARCLPLLTEAALWLWRRRPWGYLVVTSVMLLWTVENISVASDQWFGSRADPTTAVADSAMTPPFLVLAVVTLVPAVILLRALRQPGPHVRRKDEP